MSTLYTMGSCTRKCRDRRARRVRTAVLIVLLLFGGRASAESLDALDPTQDWRIRDVRVEGNEAVPARSLRDVMVTRKRPWYKFWRSRPIFDPVAFKTDLERIQDRYRRKGYYHARVEHDVEVPSEGDAVVAVVEVDEGPPVRVVSVDVEFGEGGLAPAEQESLLAGLPLAPGAVFAEEAYNGTAGLLRSQHRERGYARVKVTKRATVDVLTNTATAAYQVESGPECVFGDTVIEGNEKVAESVMAKELAFAPDRRFEASRLEQTRANLFALKLFRTVNVRDEPGADSRVKVRVRVREGPPREIRFGVGYDTETELRGSFGWRHFNFLGGARHLGASVIASFVEQTIAADFVQPHFPVSESRTTVVFGKTRQDEETFTLDRTRVSPRVDVQLAPGLTAYLSHRYEYDALSDVDDAIEARFPGLVPDDGNLSGLALGLEWSKSGDPGETARGWATRVSAEPIGGILGGDFELIRFTWEGRAHRRLLGRLVGASRLRLGAAEPMGSSDEIPLFERFYSGGINSVRGYGRRRLGPRINDDPIGGRTLVEMSIELRHPLHHKFTGVVFLDAGQVDLDSYDFPFDDLSFGSGFGVRYHSPVGPISFDLGFPFDPPGDDQPWQIHVSLGAIF